MRPPGVVRVLGKRYRYVAVEDPDEAVARGGSYGCMGASMVERGLIRYRTAGSDSSPDEEADTVLHELMHVVWSAANLSGLSIKGHDGEEHAIKCVTPILLDTLRQNPKLLEYLMKEAPFGQEEKAPAKA